MIGVLLVMAIVQHGDKNKEKATSVAHLPIEEGVEVLRKELDELNFDENKNE